VRPLHVRFPVRLPVSDHAVSSPELASSVGKSLSRPAPVILPSAFSVFSHACLVSLASDRRKGVRGPPVWHGGRKADDPVYGDRIRRTWEALDSIADDGMVDFGVETLPERLKEADIDPDELALLRPDAPVLMPAYLDLWSQTSPRPAADPDIGLFLHGARRTAAVLAGGAVSCAPALIEMDWGEWEGRRLADLRAEHGLAMAANEARGPDFRPPGGESPRMVQRRLACWLAETARRGRPTVAVAHRGVLRALYAEAAGWDMLGRPPRALASPAAHLFDITPGGRPRLRALDVRAFR